MSPLAVALWLVNAALDTCGQLAFKAAALSGSDDAPHWRRLARSPWLWAGLICYVGELVVWIAFLSLVPLSRGVLLGSINIVILMLAGRLFFRERLTPLRIAGAALVAAGVVLTGIP